MKPNYFRGNEYLSKMFNKAEAEKERKYNQPKRNESNISIKFYDENKNQKIALERIQVQMERQEKGVKQTKL